MKCVRSVDEEEDADTAVCDAVLMQLTRVQRDPGVSFITCIQPE